VAQWLTNPTRNLEVVGSGIDFDEAYKRRWLLWSKSNEIQAGLILLCLAVLDFAGFEGVWQACLEQVSQCHVFQQRLLTLCLLQISNFYICLG